MDAARRSSQPARERMKDRVVQPEGSKWSVNYHRKILHWLHSKILHWLGIFTIRYCRQSRSCSGRLIITLIATLRSPQYCLLLDLNVSVFQGPALSPIPL